jgi:hypothetical protein
LPDTQIWRISGLQTPTLILAAIAWWLSRFQLRPKVFLQKRLYCDDVLQTSLDEGKESRSLKALSSGGAFGYSLSSSELHAAINKAALLICGVRFVV